MDYNGYTITTFVSCGLIGAWCVPHAGPVGVCLVVEAAYTTEFAAIRAAIAKIDRVVGNMAA